MGGGVLGPGLPCGPTGNEQRGPNKYELELIIWIIFIAAIAAMTKWCT